MAALNNAVKHATDGFIGILDMFGFEDPKLGQLEHLCINLCAETMQHFYNTHIFKSSIESCRDEGINCEVSVFAEPRVERFRGLRGGELTAVFKHSIYSIPFGVLWSSIYYFVLMV